MVGAKYMYAVDDRSFDRYDVISFFYGGILALQDRSTKIKAQAQNQCFLSIFEAVTQTDYLLIDIEQVFTTGRYFNVIVFNPIKIWNNLAAAYE